MEYHFEVKEQIAGAALTIRTRTPVQELPKVLGEGYEAIASYLGETNKQPAGPPFAVYYNMDMQDLDVEFGFPVSRQLSGKDNIQASTTPAGKVATGLYIGPYSGLEQAYTALTKWIGEQGLTPSQVAYERYLNDPGKTPSEELKTEIAFLLVGK